MEHRVIKMQNYNGNKHMSGEGFILDNVVSDSAPSAAQKTGYSSACEQGHHSSFLPGAFPG